MLGKLLEITKFKFLDKYKYALSRKFYTIGIQFMLILVGSVLLETFTAIKLFDFWESIPFNFFIILIYILIHLMFTISNKKDFENYHVIISAEYLKKSPKDYLNYLLTHYEHDEHCSERKLNLLKSFSPLPIFLLLITNFSNLIEDFTNFTTIFYSLDSVNIFLILFLLLYLYLVITTYRKCHQTTCLIRDIQKELLLIKNPDLRASK